MDIDVARKTKATPDTCRCCGKTRHWAKDCDLHFDVRYTDTDELETELENKLAATSGKEEFTLAFFFSFFLL